MLKCALVFVRQYCVIAWKPWLALAVAAGCQMDPARPPPTPSIAPVAPVAPADAPVAPLVPVDAPVAVDAMAVAPDSDDAFRAAIRAFADRAGEKRTIAAWGTLRLDGSKKPYRFATLDVPTTKDWRPVVGAAGTGVYIVEQASDLYWPLAFWWTDGGYGIVPEEGESGGGEPAWIVHDDNAIEHKAMHNHGESRERFALRGGRFVVLYEHDYNSRADPDTVEHTWAAANGNCKRTCPPLARHDAAGHPVLMWWPARSIAELTDASIDLLNSGDFSTAPGPEVVRPR